MPRRTRAKQRGTVYLLVLGVTMMLVVLGVTAAMSARVVNETGQLQAKQTRARLLAVSYVDVVHYQMANSSNWRTTHTNNTWSSPAKAMADGLCTYKLVDEFDGVLNNDTTAPVRLYARAVVGDAVRIYSVELRIDADGDLETDYTTLRQEPAS